MQGENGQMDCRVLNLKWITLSLIRIEMLLKIPFLKRR
jgi:hypothetical protein